MSAPPYMKLYVADYLGDTHHLGALEHGAYLLLLMAMWRAGGSLPAIDANLAKMARCTTDQWAEIRDAVLPFFKRARGRLTHKRLGEELAKYENTSGKRSEAGKQGGRPKTSKNNAPDEAKAFAAESNCTHNQNQNQSKNIDAEDAGAKAVDWVSRLADALAAGGEGLDHTSTGLMHAGDLRALCEPTSGEPCSWEDVLDAIRICAARAKTRGKPVRSWSWVKEDALTLRDKRLTESHLPSPRQPNAQRPDPNQRHAASQANLARAFASPGRSAGQRWEP